MASKKDPGNTVHTMRSLTEESGGCSDHPLCSKFQQNIEEVILDNSLYPYHQRALSSGWKIRKVDTLLIERWDAKLLCFTSKN